MGVHHIDKSDFLLAYFTARTGSLTSNTIYSGFAATGLVPYDPERVLSKLNTQLRTPTPPLLLITQQASWVPETPHNIQELELQAKTIGEFIQRRTAGSSSPTDHAIQQLVKGCQLVMHSAVLLTDENKKLWTANERQKKKRAVRRSYIATGGVLTVQEGLNRSEVVDTEVTGQSVLSSPERFFKTVLRRF